MPNNMDKLIEKFNQMNSGGNGYSQRDLLKYLITRIDELDNKVEVTNSKLDNHISHLSQRVSVVETSISNYKWTSGIMITLIIGIFSMLFAQMVI